MDVSKYAALFLAESQEHLRSCNRLLLEWERAPAATEPVSGLFRAIHTIKGMAATMGYTGVADLAHRAENLLDALAHAEGGARGTSKRRRRRHPRTRCTASSTRLGWNGFTTKSFAPA